MPRVTILLSTDVPEEDAAGHVTELIHLVNKGITGHVVEKFLDFLSNESSIEKDFKALGWSDDQVRAYIESTRKAYMKDKACMGSMWDTARIEIDGLSFNEWVCGNG